MKKTAQPKNMKLLLLLVPILGVLAISGCTGSSGISYGNGLVILNWEPTFSSVESGDNIQLRIRVQNNGGQTIPDAYAVLSGINVQEWKISSGKSEAIDLGQLLPPNPSQNTAGEIRQDTYNLFAPPLPKGITQSYSPSIRIFYSYVTEAVKPITLVNENELKRLQDSGDTLPTRDTQTTAGPLKVTVNTGKFIKAKEGGTTADFLRTNTFPITIVIENTGGGVVSRDPKEMKVLITKSFNFKDDYMVNVEIIIPTTSGFEIVNCGTYGTAKEFDVQLWKGQSTSITCEMKLRTPLPMASREENIKIMLGYNYYIDSTTTVSVIGTQ